VLVCHDDDDNDMLLLLHSLVVCNLYPFSQTVSAGDVAVNDAVEQIDIGITDSGYFFNS